MTTKKAQHTPGPWRVEDTWSGRGVVGTADGRVVCNLGLMAVTTVAADARLIAAAPELLEALGAYLDQHNAAYRNFNDTDEPCACGYCRSGRAAIAKARGGQ